MKKIASYALCFVFIIVAISCSKEAPIEESIIDIDAAIDQREPLTIEEINQQIEIELQETGDFNWNDASELLLWSALQHNEGVLTIGYGANDDDYVKETTAKQTTAKNGILETIRTYEKKDKRQRISFPSNGNSKGLKLWLWF